MLMFYLAMIETDEDRNKFELIYSKYKGLMLYYARNIMKDIHLSEDVVNEAFIKIIKIIDKIRIENPSELVQYKKEIVNNCAIDYLRKIGNDRPAEDTTIDFIEHELGKDVEAVAFDNLAVEALIDYIGTMKEIYRQPLQLLYKGYKATEIAEILGENLDTVKMRIHRGRNILRKVYKEASCEK